MLHYCIKFFNKKRRTFTDTPAFKKRCMLSTAAFFSSSDGKLLAQRMNSHKVDAVDVEYSGSSVMSVLATGSGIMAFV